jgi:hypothetical protein
MDLLQCPECRQHFVVSDARDRSDWRCARCNGELEVVVCGIPGPPKRIAQALSAQFLEVKPPPH